MVNMANWWAQRGRQVTLITFDNNAPVYQLNPHIKRVALHELARQRGMLLDTEDSRVKCVRLALQMAGNKSVISFISRMNLRVLLAARGLNLKVIVSERVFPPAVSLGPEDEQRRTALYPEAFKVVVQTEYAKMHWANQFLSPDKVRVIANPLYQFNSGDVTSTAPFSFPYLLGTGRLDRQKGFDLLISAFAAIVPEHPGLKLVIAGEGSERSALEQQINALNLKDMVLLTGTLPHIHQLMSSAAVFVLSSRFEGMPNALMEAMALGVPCIAFDCATGPAELIEHEQSGLLVPTGNTDLLANSLQRMLGNKQLRQALGRQAKRRMLNFTPDKIMSLWDELVNEL